MMNTNRSDLNSSEASKLLAAKQAELIKGIQSPETDEAFVKLAKANGKEISSKIVIEHTHSQ